MRIPDWRSLVFGKGIAAEPVSDDNRIVFWLPEQARGTMSSWERVASVAGAEIREQNGIFAVSATSIRARCLHFLGRLRQRLGSGARGQMWTMPNGQQVEQVGGRHSDLLLAWTKDAAISPEDPRLRTCWPQSQAFEKVADNLILVRGVEVPQAKGVTAAAPASQESPTQLAEQMLAQARRAGDQPRLATALTDLGIVLTRQGQSQRAVSLLEEALAISQRLGSRALESDVRDSLALAVLGTGQARRALELFQQGLADARAAGSPFAEKMALSHLAQACSALRDFAQAFTLLDQALTITRQVGDRQQEAELLWQQAIVHAETGQRDQAVARGEEALRLYREMHHPQADWLESQLERFRGGSVVGQTLLSGQTGVSGPPSSLSSLPGPSSVAGVSDPGSIFGGQMVASGWTESTPWLYPGSQTPATSGSGPGLLRMAFSAMKSMAHFAGSGFKPAAADTVQKRLQTCGPCEHHTGLRCKVCGCFTSIKARLPHERCPIDKWPA